MKQRGYHLAYRHSYFADNLDSVARNAMDHPDYWLAAIPSTAAGGAGLFFEAHI